MENASFPELSQTAKLQVNWNFPDVGKLEISCYFPRIICLGKSTRRRKGLSRAKTNKQKKNKKKKKKQPVSTTLLVYIV